MSDSPAHEIEQPASLDAERRGPPWWLLIGVVFVGVIGLALLTSRPQSEPEVLLYQIVVTVDPDVEGDRERARAKIERVREELRQPGKSFSITAYQEGESLTARGNHPGEVGWTGRGVLPPHLEEVAFQLDVDEISEIIEDSYGFRILTIQARRGFLED